MNVQNIAYLKDENKMSKIVVVVVVVLDFYCKKVQKTVQRYWGYGR